MGKRSSIRSIIGKRLSDITNLQMTKVALEDGKLSENFPSDPDFIENLIMEKMTLKKLIVERNKIIELSGAELHSLRVSLQTLQMQNRHLAQSNSRILGELNLGKEKLRTLQHEIACKDALLKVKNFELEEEVKALGASTQTTNNGSVGKAGAVMETRRRQSLAPSTSCQIAADKEKVETKRRCLRRQSGRFKSQERENQENLFEIEDAKSFADQSFDTLMEEHGASMVKPFSGKNQRFEAAVALPRSSIGRPLRKAAEKVQSYKEVPLNVKMRRKEEAPCLNLSRESNQLDPKTNDRAQILNEIVSNLIYP